MNTRAMLFLTAFNLTAVFSFSQTSKTPMNTGGTSPASSGNTTKTTGNIINTVVNTATGKGTTSFTQNEAGQAIKEALLKGVATGVSKVSVTDGYFGNQLIKILFPPEAKTVESTLRQLGAGSMIDNAVKSMNRAAESAAKEAGPIFANSIKQMTINDAVNIVSNTQPDAATQFLQRTTTESLVMSFKPSIKSALDKTLATKYWKDIMSRYNQIPFVKKINTDLPDYVTRKAISGLFYMIAQEEAKIRKDPLARTSDILKKVFGNIKI